MKQPSTYAWKSGGQSTLIDPTLEKVGGQLAPQTSCFRGLCIVLIRSLLLVNAWDIWWREFVIFKQNKTPAHHACEIISVLKWDTWYIHVNFVRYMYMTPTVQIWPGDQNMEVQQRTRRKWMTLIEAPCDGRCLEWIGTKRHWQLNWWVVDVLDLLYFTTPCPKKRST